MTRTSDGRRVIRSGVLSYPGRITPGHDLAVAQRELEDGTAEQRMECECGKRSRWTSNPWDLTEARQRHAAEATGRVRDRSHRPIP